VRRPAEEQRQDHAINPNPVLPVGAVQYKTPDKMICEFMDNCMSQEKQEKRDKVDDGVAATTRCRVTSAGGPIMCAAVSLPHGQEGLLEVGQGAERQHVHRSLASQGPAGVCWGRDVVSSGRLCVAGRGEWAGS
jgi:hypothetical protein